jgi:hypothetical protein
MIIKKILFHIEYGVSILLSLALLCTCKKIKENAREPELESLRQGLKTSVAIGYCASLAMAAFKGEELPDNVIVFTNHSDEYSSSWLLYVRIDSYYPLPFNPGIGDIVVGGIGDANGGVISMVFTDIDILGGEFRLGGIHTVPVIEREMEGNILTLFARQDIVVGYGSDTLLNLNLSHPQFNTEMARLDTEQPTDAFAAVHQNVWFVTIDRVGSSDIVYDDDFTINGGGQIAEVQGVSGGIIYHSMIGTYFNYSICTRNPVDGNAFSQNLKADGTFMIDLGNYFLSFHSACNGMVHVDISTGKYWSYSGKDIDLF